MKLGVPKETLENENRVAALPESVAEYVKMGFEVLVEASAGEGAFVADERYAAAGARLVPDAIQLFAESDVVIKVKQPHFNEALGRHEADIIREGAILVTFLHPAAPVNHDRSARCATAGSPRSPWTAVSYTHLTLPTN